MSKSGGARRPHVLRQALAIQEEPRAEKGLPRQPSAFGWPKTNFWLADESADIIFISDWLTKFNGLFVLNLISWQSLRVFPAPCWLNTHSVWGTNRMSPAMCRNRELAEGLISGTSRPLRRKNWFFLAGQSARIFITARTDYDACG